MLHLPILSGRLKISLLVFLVAMAAAGVMPHRGELSGWVFAERFAAGDGVTSGCAGEHLVYVKPLQRGGQQADR